jgi:hypothetical protein
MSDDAAANSFRSGQVEALMWMQSRINAHLRGGQPLHAPGRYQDNRAVEALLAVVQDRIREVQP